MNESPYTKIWLRNQGNITKLGGTPTSFTRLSVSLASASKNPSTNRIGLPCEWRKYLVDREG